MLPAAGSGWRACLTLLIAALTVLLFADPPRASWALESGHGEEHFAAGQHDVPVVSRKQESFERSLRLDEPGLVAGGDAGLELTERPAFAAWPLPAPSVERRSHRAGGWYARGPPAAV